ncbi:hypothetical protein JOF45_000390 [Nesterenkonia lacusekhoensis]|uniref:Uncharacterized protein n=1 Tax=Nesterenkonia lacusekhoensis TaxID=150832 RepID=A0ABS4SYV0_9MICC|nr:hypothetical protein [Nesterenkonia lacusekhoensis]
MNTFQCGYCITRMPDKCMRTMTVYGETYQCRGANK